MRVLLLASLLLATAALADPPPAAAPAAAAAAAQTRVRGTIGAYDPATRLLTVNMGSKTVKTMTVTLGANLRIITNQRRKVADIKAGDFIAASALKTPDGKLRAQQVNVFPEEFRGMGEGQYPTGDASANRLMTNATVTENTGALKVSYHGAQADAKGVCGGHANAAGSPGCTGEAEISVATGVPVIGLMLGDESLLVPGAAVSLIVNAGADGQPAVTRLTVEKDGVKPIL